MSIPKDVMDQLIKAIEPALSPDKTADRIISEVMKNGTSSKNAVVKILREHIQEVLSKREQFIKKTRLEHSESHKES